MSFALDATETEILDTVRAIAARRLPLSIEPARPYREFYAEVGDLGFFGLNVPEANGGLGLGDFHAGLVAYGFGRELVPGPWLEHLVAVAAASGGEAFTDFEALLSGTKLAGELVSRRAADGQIANGAAELATARVAAGVDLWLVALEDGTGGRVLAAVDAGANGVDLREEASVDLGWSAGSLVLAGAPCNVVADWSVERAAEVTLLAAGLAAMSEIGSSERLLDDTVAFAKDREQFGQAIGAFQAVKHRLAELYIEIEHARNLTFAALASSGAERERLVPMAKLLADEVYRDAAETSIQLHGGFGFTWECPSHLFLKNALRLRTYPSTADSQRTAIRRQLGLERLDYANARTEELV